MRSLRELGEFVGIPQNSTEDPPGYFGPTQPIGLRAIRDLLSPITALSEKGSMRAMSEAVQQLPPINLECRLLNRFGVEPHSPIVRVSGSNGLVISTRITIIRISEAGPGAGQTLGVNYGSFAGDFTPAQLAAGDWSITVRRIGISSNGFQNLVRYMWTRVSQAQQPPPSTPVVPAQQLRPTIQVEKDGPNSAVQFTVTGSDFLPNQKSGIAVRFVDANNFSDWLMLHTDSDSSGKILLKTGAFNSLGLQPNSLGQRIVSVSATDSRTDPNSVPKNEPLWSNIVSIYF